MAEEMAAPVATTPKMAIAKAAIVANSLGMRRIRDQTICFGASATALLLSTGWSLLPPTEQTITVCFMVAPKATCPWHAQSFRFVID